jgi:hypothetical protein
MSVEGATDDVAGAVDDMADEGATVPAGRPPTSDTWSSARTNASVPAMNVADSSATKDRRRRRTRALTVTGPG